MPLKRHPERCRHDPRGGRIPREIQDDIIRLSEQGECPVCAHPLERATMSAAPGVRGVQVYWRCTSEYCALMFWRKPKRREVIKHY